MMNRPKLKDKIYGEMFWEEWDADENYWYAPMKTDAGDGFSLLIRADSPTDFMTVGGTYATYKRLLENVNSIRGEMIDEIMENSRRLFKKKRQKNSISEEMKKSLKLFSVKIYSDLSSEISFIGEVAENEDPDETFYALIDNEGNFIEAGIEDL